MGFGKRAAHFHRLFLGVPPGVIDIKGELQNKVSFINLKVPVHLKEISRVIDSPLYRGFCDTSGCTTG